MTTKLILTLFSMLAPLCAELQTLSFDQLGAAFNGQEVEVRGFFYESKEGKHILAAQPNLKSCCVGSSKKISRQIVLLGDLPEMPQQRAVTVRGVFAAAPTFGEDDELIGLYYLKNIELLNEFDDTAIYSLVAFFVIVLFMVVGVLLYRRRK